MKKVDTLIVGLGIAGLAYAERLRKQQQSFYFIDEGHKGSTQRAAGLYNPTVLKRFTLSWRGVEFHKNAIPFYTQLDQDLQINSLERFSILKLFHQPTDHNLWVTASDKSGLDLFLDPKRYTDHMHGVNAPHGYSKVQHCGRLNTPLLLSAYAQRLEKEERIRFEKVDHSSFELAEDSVRYKNIEAKRVIFCEGFKMKQNPFFNSLPLVGSKGEILIIKAPKLQLKTILKGPIFIVPLGDDMYWAGATFNRTDKTTTTSEEGRQWLVAKIDSMLKTPYSIVKHIAQIRPTVADRRPLVGQHPFHNKLYLLNGFGSRGVLTAPTASQWLYDFIQNEHPLPEEVNLARFIK